MRADSIAVEASGRNPAAAKLMKKSPKFAWHNLPVIDLLEKDLKTTVVSSIPAQVWATKKLLQLNEPVTGYGRLLAEMP